MAGKAVKSHNMYIEPGSISIVDEERLGTTCYSQSGFTSTIYYQDGDKHMLEVFVSESTLLITHRRNNTILRYAGVGVGAERCAQIKEFISANDGSYYTEVLAKIIAGEL